MPVLVIDAANVIGSRPDGWWRDRPGAAGRFTERVIAAIEDGKLQPPVVIVLEGRARAGVPERTEHGVEVVHAPGDGDDTIAALAARSDGPHGETTVVTADRGLADRCRAAGATVVGPRRLLDRLPP